MLDCKIISYLNLIKFFYFNFGADLKNKNNLNIDEKNKKIILIIVNRIFNLLQVRVCVKKIYLLFENFYIKYKSTLKNNYFFTYKNIFFKNIIKKKIILC